MNGHVSVTPSLGRLITQVVDGSRSLNSVLETVERWETDMESRERAAIRANEGTGETVIMAVRARGMHLAALSLGVRLELLLEGTDLQTPIDR